MSGSNAISGITLVGALISAGTQAIVLGASDVVNPLARSRSGTPLVGMPNIDVDKARTVVVLKRSLGAGFSGVPNPLFAADNTLMYYGDGKEAILDLIAALKET